MYLQITFYNERYDASRKEDHVSWPPAPYRVYCAIVHAAYIRMRAQGKKQLDNDTRKMLNRLACHDWPVIYAGEPIQQNGRFYHEHGVYMPFGMEGYGTSEEDKKKWVKGLVTHYSVFPTHNKVYYKLPDDLHGLDPLVKYIPWLGKATSQVMCAITETHDAECIQYSHQEHGMELSTTRPNLLDDLDKLHEDRTLVLTIEKKRYGRTPRWARIFTWRFKAPLFIKQTAEVASAMRTAILKCQGDKDDPAITAKNDHLPHCAYVPLPCVGYRGTGLIMGLAFLVPGDIPPASIRHCERVARKLLYLDVGDKRVALIPSDETSPKAVTKERWQGPSQYWASVTPAEVNWKKSANDQVRAEANCQHIIECLQKRGLPEPRLLVCPQCSLVAGSRCAENFLGRHQCFKKGELPEYFRTHVYMEFDEPLQGPIILGNTRNFGMGLMMPLADRKSLHLHLFGHLRYCQ